MRASSSGRRRTSGGSSASQAGGGGAATRSTTSSLSTRKEPTAHSAALRPPSGSVPPARSLHSTRVLQREVASRGRLPSHCRNAPITQAGRLPLHPAVAAETVPGWRRRMHTSKKPIPGARPAWPCWRWRPAGLAWTLWALVVLGLLAIGWLDQLLRQAGRADLAPLTAQTAAPMLAALTAATVGALLGSRRPRHPVGWLLLGFGLSLTAIGIFMGYANYGLLAGSDALPAARAAVRYYPTAIDAVSGAVGSFVLLLTPTGALPSPRWRWWAGVTAAVLVVLLLVVTLAPEPLIGRYQAGDTPLRPHAFGGALLVANQVAFAVTLVAVVG